MIYHTFKMAAMTFHIEKCCYLMSAHAVSAWRPLWLPPGRLQFCLQFLIRSKFIIVVLEVLQVKTEP